MTITVERTRVYRRHVADSKQLTSSFQLVAANWNVDTVSEHTFATSTAAASSTAAAAAAPWYLLITTLLTRIPLSPPLANNHRFRRRSHAEWDHRREDRKEKKGKILSSSSLLFTGIANNTRWANRFLSDRHHHPTNEPLSIIIVSCSAVDRRNGFVLGISKRKKQKYD